MFASSRAVWLTRFLVRVEVLEQVHLLGAVVAGQHRVAAAQGAGQQGLGGQAAERGVGGLLGGFEVAVEPAVGDVRVAGGGALHVVLALKWLRVPSVEPTLTIGTHLPGLDQRHEALHVGVEAPVVQLPIFLSSLSTPLLALGLDGDGDARAVLVVEVVAVGDEGVERVSPAAEEDRDQGRLDPVVVLGRGVGRQWAGRPRAATCSVLMKPAAPAMTTRPEFVRKSRRDKLITAS